MKFKITRRESFLQEYYQNESNESYDVLDSTPQNRDLLVIHFEDEKNPTIKGRISLQYSIELRGKYEVGDEIEVEIFEPNQKDLGVMEKHKDTFIK